MPACHAGDRRFESGRVRHSSLNYPHNRWLITRSCFASAKPDVVDTTSGRDGAVVTLVGNDVVRR